MTAEQAQARIDSQATDEQRRAAADIVIDNSGGLVDLTRAVDDVWATLVERVAAQAEGQATGDDRAP